MVGRKHLLVNVYQLCHHWFRWNQVLATLQMLGFFNSVLKMLVQFHYESERARLYWLYTRWNNGTSFFISLLLWAFISENWASVHKKLIYCVRIYISLRLLVWILRALLCRCPMVISFSVHPFVSPFICLSVRDHLSRADLLTLWPNLAYISPTEYLWVKGLQWPWIKCLGQR